MPDLILLDIMMPKKDGYMVCEELKRDARSAHIPIIFLSAKTQVEDEIKGLDLGGAGYVTKPFDRGVPSALVTVSASQMLHPNKGLLLKKAIKRLRFMRSYPPHRYSVSLIGNIP